MSVFLLIDETGALFDASRWEVRLRLGCQGTTSEVIASAVKQRGWIGLAHHATSVEIHMRRTDPAPRTVQLAIDLVMGTLASKIVLVHWGNEWRRETFASPAAAILRIEELMAAVSSSAQAVPFRSTSRTIQDLWRDGNRTLIMALQQFQNRIGIIDAGDACALSHLPGMGTTSVFERPKLSTSLIIRAVSPFVRFYDQRRRPAFEGKDLRQQPNPDYNRWIVDTFDRIIDAGEPLLDDVDAVVQQPDGLPLQMSYRRVAAPYRTPSGSQLIVTTSVLIPLPRRDAVSA
ncbi:MAG: hypothetical protein HYR63_04890 [Proteobacteria bacterium]|nr:hypothetical protein [Pseudomonadota bacterium]MBI3496626.1 hypothetical protein [Pseudomonadota bacterium]